MRAGLLCEFHHCVHVSGIEHTCVLRHVWLFVTPWTWAFRLLCPWNFLGKNTGMGCHFLLQGIVPTQGLNLGLPHCRQTLPSEPWGNLGLRLNIQKIKIMASSPITSWQIDGETVETVEGFIFLASKITADGDYSHELKDACSLEGKLWPT